jgi:hypothetical protein
VDDEFGGDIVDETTALELPEEADDDGAGDAVVLVVDPAGDPEEELWVGPEGATVDDDVGGVVVEETTALELPEEADDVDEDNVLIADESVVDPNEDSAEDVEGISTAEVTDANVESDNWVDDAVVLDDDFVEDSGEVVDEGEAELCVCTEEVSAKIAVKVVAELAAVDEAVVKLTVVGNGLDVSDAVELTSVVVVSPTELELVRIVVDELVDDGDVLNENIVVSGGKDVVTDGVVVDVMVASRVGVTVVSVAVEVDEGEIDCVEVFVGLTVEADVVIVVREVEKVVVSRAVVVLVSAAAVVAGGEVSCAEEVAEITVVDDKSVDDGDEVEAVDREVAFEVVSVTTAAAVESEVLVDGCAVAVV